MIVTKFRPPYKPNGRTSYPEAANKPGVYIIKKNGKIVYVGMSASNVYKTMYRHFQSWDDPTQVRITYNARSKKVKYSVRVIFTTPKQAERLAQALILKMKPLHNPDKLKNYKLKPVEIKEANNYCTATVEPCPF